MPPRTTPVTKLVHAPSPKANPLSNPEPTNHLRSSNVGNPLMAVYVTAVMGPKKQSIVRCAGSVGVDIYEEVVIQGLSGTHLELSRGMDGSDMKQHVPFHIGPSATSMFDKDHVLIIAPSDLEMLENQGGDNRIRNRVKYIRLICFENMTIIESHFMYGCTSLTAIDMSPLSNITSIGSYFMFSCTSLTAIDMSPLSNVTSIGSGFMAGCTSLVTVDMSPLTNVTSIGPNFMADCSSLAAIDMSPLSNVTSIGSFFLVRCTSLAAIDMSPLANVTSIGSDFLSNCTSLVAIDMSPFSNVTSIGSSFLGGCTSLTAIDMSPLSKVTSVDVDFMYDCTSLVDARLPPNVVADSTMFLGCVALSPKCVTGVQ